MSRSTCTELPVLLWAGAASESVGNTALSKTRRTAGPLRLKFSGCGVPTVAKRVPIVFGRNSRTRKATPPLAKFSAQVEWFIFLHKALRRARPMPRRSQPPAREVAGPREPVEDLRECISRNQRAAVVDLDQQSVRVRVLHWTIQPIGDIKSASNDTHCKQ